MSSMKRTYMPLLTMLEPKGSRFSSLLSWIYFRNPKYHIPYHDTENTFTRICGWESARLNIQPSKETS